MYLPTGTLLHNRYSIEQVIGQGGFGVTYLARDLTLHVKVAVKEYLPRQLASRAEGQTKVTVYSGEAREHFAYGLKKFLEEARSVARFATHPNIVSARDYFEANGTAYMVMEYIEGVTFKQFLEQKGGRIPFELASQIMMPVMDALREVHVTGLLHRDISPDNVYITADGRIKLLDFGAARYFAGEQSKSLSVILKTGYAPEEQYRSSGKQGAWTDVYASAATMYRAITGRTPPDALDRKEEDTLESPSRLGVAVTPAAEQALMKALAVNAQSRFQDMGEFQAALRSESIMPSSPTAQVSGGFTQPYHAPPQWSPISTAGQIPAKSGPVRRKKASSAATAIIISVAVFVLVGSGVLWYAGRIGSKAEGPQGQTAPPAVVVDPHKAFVPGTTPKVPDKPAAPRATEPVVSEVAPPSVLTSVLAKEVFEQGRALYKQENFSAAIPKLEEAVRLDPTRAQAYYILGWTYNQVDRSLEALECFQKALALKRDALTYDGLSWTYNKLSRHSEAVAAGEQAVKLEFHFPDAHYNVGMAYLALGNLDMARKEYDALLNMQKEKAKAKMRADMLRESIMKQSFAGVSSSPGAAGPSINGAHNNEASKFVHNYLMASSNNNLNEVLNYYAPVVNYFDKGVVAKKIIDKDKTDYFSRWPNKQYTVVGEIKVEDVTNELKIVEFRINFVVQNSKNMIKGIADNKWQIKKINNQFKIVNEKQQVISREKL